MLYAWIVGWSAESSMKSCKGFERFYCCFPVAQKLLKLRSLTNEGRELYYTVATNFRLEFLEPSARKAYIFWLREKSGEQVRRGEENMVNLARLATTSEFKKKLLTLNLSSRRL